jgi:hypothetical protein
MNECYQMRHTIVGIHTVVGMLKGSLIVSSTIACFTILHGCCTQPCLPLHEFIDQNNNVKEQYL